MREVLSDVQLSIPGMPVPQREERIYRRLQGCYWDLVALLSPVVLHDLYKM